ncbi:hypothetical protein F5B22DRAFT_464804 [Xylaria bambusicola]|uniref:uncharacterized protein n=1 Tax=Xylaria bambusicola TaxID=326684 RepID=UPI00200771AD|nr:uncharacterized protein F5B22DRAFT_464804 [Xylaria bambusicola]KAI0522218.1 hypothetical protein F5B22DRAFT_464804 [Xylaria bambusicola]
MEHLFKRAQGFPNWSQTPIPNVDISAAGLLALADLSTIAQRTRISGASWVDVLLLAPGLHYQQAADAVLNEIPSPFSAVESVDGKTSRYAIANTATLQYLERVGRAGQRIIVDVGRIPQRRYFPYGNDRAKRRSFGQRSAIWRDQEASIGWISQVLYLASPVLTIIAFVFMVLLREWWGVAALLGLMLSRVLNIWIIKQRTNWPKKPQPIPGAPGSDPDNQDALTEYVVDLGRGRVVALRGLTSDLQAITTTSWLRDQTHVEGYLEAAAKLTVYLVAAFSGNLSQIGSIIFLGLLLVTAGLLGLSNAHAKALSMHGRLAAPTIENLPRPDSPPYPDSRLGSSTWRMPSDGMASGGLSTIDDFTERH